MGTFNGYLSITEGDYYSFTLSTEDSVQFYIDDQLFIQYNSCESRFNSMTQTRYLDVGMFLLKDLIP